MCDSGHDSLASDSSNSLGLGTPSPPPLEPQGRAPPPSYKPAINPPNITPVGGVPNFTSNAGLVRPIAFRPTPVKEPGGQGGRGPQGQASLTLKPGGHIKDFAPGHPLAKKSKFYGSSQDLSRPSGPPSSLSKYSSLDRRSLARRLGPQGPHQGVRLAAWEPEPGQAIEPPKPRPGKEPERRHSSYNPSSSLTRTPSQNSEYRHRVAQQRLERRQERDGGQQQHQQQNQHQQHQQQNQHQQHQQQPTNPIHVSGLPDPFRQSSSQPSPGCQGGRPGSVRSTEGRVRLSGAGTPQFPPLSVSRLSQNSLTNLNLSHSSHPPPGTLKRTDSARKSQADPGETSYMEGSEEEYQTPSPADSAVGDLEQVLREKEGEIVYLRDTLEQNEQVIFRVYEEKEKTWEREIRKIKGLYETQLKAHQMKASKMEAALANQTYQVQNEKRKLEQEVRLLADRTRHQAEENKELKGEISFLRGRLPVGTAGDASAAPEGEHQATEKAEQEEERSKLKDEVNTYKEELRQAKEVIEDLMANRKSLAEEVDGLKGLLSGLDEDFSLHEVKAQKAIIIERDQELEQLKAQLKSREEVHNKLRQEHDQQVEQFEMETANWLSEKEKVIRYQKQLQLNYVSMYKKNKTLEQEMEQLKASLSDREERKSTGGHVSSAKAKLFSKFSSKFAD